MRSRLSLAALLACTACSSQPQGAAAPAAVAAAPPPPECRDYSIPVTVGGQPVTATGTACRQPDNSWRVTQETPGLPTQSYVVPPPPYPYGPYFYAPYFSGGIGTAFFFGTGFGHDRFFHHDHDFDHMHHM